MAEEKQSWRGIQEKFKLYIRDGIWKPGQLIPKEVELAEINNCSRTTVNRALRKLAEDGFLERRRKGGTRVVNHPVRVAKLDIPIVRKMIEERGGVYRHEVISAKSVTASQHVVRKMRLDDTTRVMHINTLYYSNNSAFAYETRWVNIAQVPDIVDVQFDRVSANEWLVNNVPLSNCDIHFSAKNATSKEAKLLNIAEGKAILVLDRTTWLSDQAVTHVRLCFKPGYEMITSV